MLSRLMTERGDLVKTTLQYKMTLKYIMKVKRSTLTMRTICERIEAAMDFKIPGLPHSIVKHAQSASVRELIRKIENHPNRHALLRDLRQSQSFNPFSPESKQMIHEVGNIELCEIARDGTQSAMQSLFLILGHRHRLLHVRALLACRKR